MSLRAAKKTLRVNFARRVFYVDGGKTAYFDAFTI